MAHSKHKQMLHTLQTEFQSICIECMYKNISVQLGVHEIRLLTIFYKLFKQITHSHFTHKTLRFRFNRGKQ